MAGDEDYPQRVIEQELAPGHSPDDEMYHEYRDENGNVIKQYDMDAEEIHVDPQAHVDWNTVVSLMVQKAEVRLGDQIPYAQAAVIQFQQRSSDQIAQFVHDNAPDVAVGWGQLVEGLVTGFMVVFAPEAEFAKFVFETAAHVLTAGLENQLEAATSHLTEAKAKLEHGVATLVTEVDKQTLKAVDAAKPHVRPAIEHGMADYQQVTADPEWIEEMVHWFGFPERTEDTVTAPILQWLEFNFGTVLSQVQSEISAHPS